MSRNPPIVVWFPDDQTYLVADASLVHDFRDSILAYTLREGTENIREFIARKAEPHDFPIRLLADRHGSDES